MRIRLEMNQPRVAKPGDQPIEGVLPVESEIEGYEVMGEIFLIQYQDRMVGIPVKNINHFEIKTDTPRIRRNIGVEPMGGTQP